MPSFSFTLPGSKARVEIEADDHEAALNAIGDDPNFGKDLAKLVDGAGYTRFQATGQNDVDSWVDELTTTFFRDGVEAAEAYIRETVSYSPENHYQEFIAGSRPARALTIVLRAALLRAFENEDAAEIEEAVDVFVRDRAAALLDDDDDSKPFDAIEPYSKVVVGYFIGQDDTFPNVEDESLQSFDKSIHPESVDPSRLLGAYFSFLNVPKEELLAAWKTEFEVDVLQPYRQRDQSDYSWNQQLARAAAWAEFDWTTDPARPRLETPKKIYEVMANGDYCSVPVLVFRANLKQLLTRDWEAPLQLSPGSRGFVGEIALHNFIHGAGHARPLKEPVVLPPGKGGFRPTEDTGYGYVKVYDLAPGFLDAEISDGPKVEPTPEEPAAGPRP